MDPTVQLIFGVKPNQVLPCKDITCIINQSISTLFELWCHSE